MIYLDQRWAPVLLNYVCKECFAQLKLRSEGPTCRFHPRGMWLHKDRRALFQGLRREVKARR